MSLHSSSVVAALNDWIAPDTGQDALRHSCWPSRRPARCACQRSRVPGTYHRVDPRGAGNDVLLTLHPRLGRWVQ